MSFTGLPPLSQRMGWSRIFVERGGKLPAANALLSQLGLSPIVPN